MSKSRFRIGQWVKLTNPDNRRVKLGSTGQVVGTRGRGWMVYVVFNDDQFTCGCHGTDIELLKGRERAVAMAIRALGVKP